MGIISFQQLIVLLLATTGLTFITNKSRLLNGVRVWITERHVAIENEKLMGRRHSFAWFWWWAQEVSNCYMCASVYTGSIVAGLIYLSISLPWVMWFLYPFAAVPVVCMIIQNWTIKERSR